LLPLGDELMGRMLFSLKRSRRADAPASIRGSRSAPASFSAARDWSMRAAARARSRLSASASSTSAVSGASPNEVHQSAATCAIGGVDAGRCSAGGVGSAGGGTAQPASTAASAMPEPSACVCEGE